VKKEAQNLASQAKDVAGQAADKAKDLASQAGEAISGAASAVGRKAEDATAAVGHGIENLAGQVRDSGPQSGMLGTATRAVADTLEGTGKYLEDKNLSGMMDDVTGLMRGITNDIGDLIRHEIKFARTEMKADLRKTRDAAAVLALGAGAVLLGAILLALMLVHLLYHVSLPAEEVTRGGLPMWACYGIVSAVFLVLGAVGVYAGCAKFQSFNPLPDQTAQTVKENVGWIANSK
jgi:hypothetical protein